MSASHFPVYWRFDGTSQGTVTIDRGSGTFAVRLYRRRRAYELPLAFVAQLIAERVMKAEAREKVAARKAKRKAGR